MATTSNLLSLRALPFFLILSLLLPSETAGRVGSTGSQQDVENGGESSLRKLAGGYGRPYQPYTPPKHSGQYYIKRPIDPSEHYNNYKPAAKPTDPYPVYPEPTVKPSNKPTPAPYSVLPKIPISGSPKPTSPPLPTFKPTALPTLKPTEPPQPQPTPEPTKEKEEAPPTFGPGVDIEVENEILKPSNETIMFEPPTQIQSRIAEFALQGGAEFEDVTSYQSAALRRVEAQVGADGMTDVKLMQYYSLYCILEATNSKTNDFIIQSRAFGDGLSGIEDNIPGWKITSGWLETDLDPCEGEWYGVSCVDEQIVTLDLFDNGLTGNFAPEVVLLAGDGFFSTGAGSLVSLDIFNNELMSNNGDNSWMQDLGSQLGYLYVQNTVFSGRLPQKFPDGLVELDIANSLITGDLQGAAFENLSSLRFLLMDGVQFNSSIPSEIAQLPNLEYLFATDSMITGDLSYMESMPVIFEHWVDRNPGLGGPIPSFLGSLTTLQSFSIAECGFTGTIPESLGNLGLMQQMWLYGNQLSGEIPASLGNLSFMRIFEVEDNNLSDSMPQSICDNLSTGMLEVLGGDCDKLDCPCCTCCTVDECREQN